MMVKVVANCTLKNMSKSTMVHYIGSFPKNAAWMKYAFENIDFEERRKKVGRIPINDVEVAQKTLLCLLQE